MKKQHPIGLCLSAFLLSVSLSKAQEGAPSESPGEPGLVEADRLVGIAIDSGGGVDAWTAAGTVSSGFASNFAWTRGPSRFSAAPFGSGAILAIDIDSDNRVHTWYANGTHSVGTRQDLDGYEAPAPFATAGEKAPEEIVGIAIDKSTDHVYAWYEDGYVSKGTSTDLGASTYHGVYSLPRGKAPADVVDMAFAPRSNHVLTWYKDGRWSEGTPADLDAHGGLARYARHGILRSTYPANPPPLPTITAGGLPPLYDMAPNNTFSINTTSHDNVVATGHNYVAVAFDSSVSFYDRSGNPLLGDNLNGNALPLNDMFGPFMRKSVSDAQNATDVNHYLGFPKSCDTYPVTRAFHFCVSDVPYDTRVEYDAIGRRFVILAQIRNPLWTSLFGANPGAPLGDTEWHSYYATSPSDTKVDAGNDGLVARRLKVIAISRSEDPRDGFHTYAFVQNNYRDWPWMSINGNWLTLSNKHNASHIDGPVATLLPLDDLRKGRERPRYIDYYREDLHGAISAEPPRQYGSLTTHSLLAGADASGAWRIFALPHPAAPYAKEPAGSTLVDTTWVDMGGMISERFAYRDGYLHMAGHPKTYEKDGRNFYAVNYYRLGLSLNGDTPQLSYNWASGTFRNGFWGDDSATEDVSNTDPSLAVNAAGDVMIVYGEFRRPTIQGPLPGTTDVMRVLWPANAWSPGPPEVWQAGGLSQITHGSAVKALAACVDPLNNHTFWGIHKFVAPDGQWDTFVGAFSP
jgi:hypothetical protein